MDKILIYTNKRIKYLRCKIESNHFFDIIKCKKEELLQKIIYNNGRDFLFPKKRATVLQNLFQRQPLKSEKVQLKYREEGRIDF